MSVIEKLASSLGRRDEVPNQELAKQLVKNEDKNSIQELVDLLQFKKKNIQSDSIKVLYEIGEQNPALISNYVKEFVPLLNHKNNRMIWGAMSALNAITAVKPEAVYPHLAKIMEAVDKGSVITRDQAVSMLVKFCSTPKYFDAAFTLLLEQLKSCPPNQLPMYAENMLPVVIAVVVDPPRRTNNGLIAKCKEEFITILSSRLDDMATESKKKRIEKVITKLNKGN